MEGITKTGLNRNKAFWFLLLTSFIISMIALFTVNVVNGNIVSSYLLFCTSIMGFIMGTKSIDNGLKSSIKKEEIKKGDNSEYTK